MKTWYCKRLPALLLALAMALSLAACASRTPDPQPVEEEEPPPPQKTFYNTLPKPTITSADLPPLVDLVLEKTAQNQDTVGWLQIPGTTIDDVVVWYPHDENQHYYRLNFAGEYSMAGVLYADFRCQFDGSVEDMSRNTCIYGHTLSADIDGVMFAPLKYFTQEEFAKKTPYVYFSTREEDVAWEVFAVFYATVYLPYNRPDMSQQEWADTLDECIARSIYNYDTEVTAEDRVLTMSTCTYSVPGIGSVGYPNDYRYVVMAKQVDTREATKTVAEFEVNPSPKAP